jgi:hypothetical protein
MIKFGGVVEPMADSIMKTQRGQFILPQRITVSYCRVITKADCQKEMVYYWLGLIRNGNYFFRKDVGNYYNT